MSQNLYNFLVEKGDYTKSYEDFVSQFSTPSSQDSLYNFMSQKGDYTKNNNDFKNQFFNQSTDYNVAGDNISISQQEMDEIISQANADPVEKIKKGEIEQKQFNPYAKGYGAYVAPRKEIKYQSYVFDEFLNEDQSNVEQAKQQWISKKRKELLQGKLEEQLEDLEDKIIPWYSIRGVDPIRPIHDAMYASKRAILTNEFKAKEQQANEDYKKLSNKLTSDKQAIEGIDLKLNNIKSRYDRNTEALTQQDVDGFNDLILTREAAVDAFNDDLERLDNLGVKSQDFNTIADMTQRTYNNIDVAANRISSAVLEGSAGLVDFAYNFSVPGLMKNIGGIDVQKEEDIQTLPTFIQPIARQMGTVVEGENITTDKLRKNAEEINNFTKHRQEFNKIDSIENFGEFVLDLFSEQLVNTAVTASTGGVGLAIVSASAAGNKMNQMSIDIEKYLETGGKEGQMISPLQFYTTGVGYGLAEYVTERVALKQFKGARKAFNDAVNLDGMGRYSLKEFKFTDAAKRYGINVNQEGSAELFAGGTQNFLDKYVLGQDVDLRDNLLESYISGALVSGLGFQAPVLAQDIYRSFSTTSEWSKINTNSKKIASLQEDLKNLYRKNVNDPQVKEAIKLNNEQINDLLVENLRIKKVAENRIDDLSADDKGSLIHLTSEAYKHKKKIDEINSNENLTQQQKEYLIIKHADKLDSLYSKQEQIRKSATFSKDKERNKKATIEYAILTGRKIENITIEKGDNAVEKIQAYIDGSDISPELKNQFKTEIKEVIEANPYVHGAHFGKEFGLPISIQFADNATRGIGGNATVFSHELGHGTLFRALVEQGADVVQLTKNLEGYVKKRFPKLYSKFIKTHRLYREGDAAYRAEEVLAMTTDFMRQYNIEADKSLQGKLIDGFNSIVRKNKNISETNEVKTGGDVFNLLKSFAFGFEAGEISGLAARVIKGEADILKTDKPVSKEKQPAAFSKVSPKAKAFLETKDEEGKLMFTNEMLVDIVNAKRSKQEDKFAAIEALIEKNWPVISKALKFNPSGDITMESIKTAISEQMTGIFPKITLPNGQTVNREGKRLLDTYNKKNTVTTFLDNTLGPRQAEIFTRAKTIDATSQGVSLDEAKNIAVSTELENATSNQQDTRKRINVLKIPKVAKVAKDIRQDTKVIEGDTHKQVTKNNEGHIGNKIFNIPENKITKPNQNLTTSDDIVSVETGEVITKEELDAGATGILSPSESKSVQDVFADYNTTEQFIKILPKTNVSEKDALINEIGKKIRVSRNVYGRAIGLQDRILEYFYEPLFKPNGKRARSQGKTSQVPLWTLKEQFINPKKDVVVQFQRDLGITEQQQVNILPTEEQRSIIGQLLKGAARTLSQQVSLSAAQRNLEAAGASPQQIADVTAGQSKIAFSKNADAVFGGIKSLLSEKQGKIFDDNLLQFVSTFVGVNEAKMSDKQKEQVLLSEDVEAISIALNQTYGDVISKNVREDIAREIQKEVAKLKLKPKSKNIVKQEKIVEAIIKSTEDSTKKIAKYTGSDITAAKAQNDLVRQEDRRRSDAVHFVNLFDKNKEQAVADLIILGGSSFTSAKIGDGRGQFYKNSRDYYNYHLGNVGIEPVYNKNGSLNVKATAKKNGLKDIPVTKAAQSSTSAIKDHKNPESLKERRKHEKHARKVLNEYVAHNAARYKDGLQDNVDIMLMMNSLLSNMNSVLARAAALKYIEPGIKAADARYEHMQPRVAVLIKLVDAHINQGGIENIDNFLANYDIAIINKKFDKAITDAGYQSILAEGQSLDDSSLLRYYNDKTLTDNKVELLIEVGTNKVPKLVESFMKGNDLLKPKIKEFNTLNKSIMFSRSTNESKGITVLDFDDTLATTKSLVKFTRPDGTTGTLNAEQYASTYEDLLDQGFTFDFSEFNKVVKGKLAPLFQKALKLQGKFGPENMFVLTARPPAAQKAIFDFLKANGLNIPIKNITGLGNSTAEAKALWVADKVGEGYNDFYFADDALQNVQAVKNMLDQFDVKSKVQQAKVKFSKDMNTEFNNILEDVTKIDSGKRFSEQKARKRGASKGKFRLFIPPSHEDFVGLLYNFMGKGRKGDQHRDFFEQALVRPLNRAYREIDTAKQAIANDYKELNKQFVDVKKKLRKKTPDGDYIFEDAVRIYLWNKHGYDIPGLSKTDQANLSELVMSDPQLQAYAETLNVISKQDTYVEPGKGWDGGNIKTDLIDATGRVGRAQYFTEFNENADVIFSPENLNKIEAAYGRNFRSAVEDILHRIKTGVNRPKGQSGTVNAFMNYLNGSVGTVMFFNVRSAILQQMSIVNYINFADNNIFAAGKAFANQPQYWKDFAFIFNSDMLKQRRGGIGTDINGNDLAQAVAGSKNPTKIVISKLLKLGFLPTQIGDNIAIATGGATFYRNRINKYIKDGLSKKEAESRAFTDFQDLTQSTQQSSRPDMTSQQQASWIGKLVLNFQNITSQYNRIIKKAALDIGKGRISPPYTTRTQSNLGNLSKILYYGAIQNVIFYSLQTALFAVMFNDDEDEDQILKKRERVIQGSIDSILRGAGIYGAVASTLKNAYIRFKEQREKGYNKDESAVPLELANFSPVVGIKLRQLVNAEKTLNYNENVIGEMETFEADNPMWSAVTNYTQALTNFPANRLYQKSINMRNALDKDYTNFQRVLFFSGYTTWSLGLGDTEAVIEAKEKVKINKANAKKEKRAQKQIEKIAANKSIVEENKKKKDGRCAAISTSGKRCSNKAVKDGFCSIHEKVEQREDGKKLRCRKTKSDGTRCRMMTTNKSQYCYYHD